MPIWLGGTEAMGPLPSILPSRVLEPGRGTGMTHTDRQGEKLNWVTGPMGSKEPEGFLKVVAAG